MALAKLAKLFQNRENAKSHWTQKASSLLVSWSIPPLAGSMLPRGSGVASTSGAARGLGGTPVSNTGKKLFVTVGTTSFDALIHALDDADTVSLLRRAGFKHVTVQFGRGELGRATGGGLAHLVSGEELTVTLFDFKPSLREDMRSADLVVTHAGAGSVFECLNLPVPCLVVVNAGLMGNHQTELARALADRQYLRWCVPATLKIALQTFDAKKLVAYEGGNPNGVRLALDEMLG